MEAISLFFKKSKLLNYTHQLLNEEGEHHAR